MNVLTFLALLTLSTVVFMAAWYLLALYFRRYDIVDSAWGIGFVVIAWLSIILNSNYGAVQVVSALLVSAWGVRLFAHISLRNWPKHQDDKRYQAFAEKWGTAVKQKMFTNIFLLQGLLLLLVSAPMVAITRSTQHNISGGVIIGWAIWIIGIIFEAVADQQLGQYLATRPNGSHAPMSTGLWRYSRHPNYFGEVVTWWGASITALAVGGWWGVMGAIVITILITKVSGIPIIEAVNAKRPEYDDYRRRTSVFFPLPPRGK